MLYHQLTRGGDASQNEAQTAAPPVPLFLLHFFDVTAPELGRCLARSGTACALCTNFTHFASPLRKSLREESLDVMAAYYG